MNNSHRVIHGDSSIILGDFEDNIIDSIITDPPYGIDFLSKEWDRNNGSIEVWEQCYRVLKPGGHLLAFASPRTYHRLATIIEDIGFEIRDQIVWIKATSPVKCQDLGNKELQLKGWRNNLKAGHEPILLARKPIEGNLVDNMLTYKTGALNIDKCRIGDGEKRIAPKVTNSKLTFGEGDTTAEYYLKEWGDRYPSNVIGELDDSIQKYFYCPRVSRKERGENNNHPTVKPISLMSYLIRLVSWENAIILDPFCGSGSTGIACKKENRRFIGIEMDREYTNIAKQRIEQYNEV